MGRDQSSLHFDLLRLLKTNRYHYNTDTLQRKFIEGNAYQKCENARLGSCNSRIFEVKSPHVTKVASTTWTADEENAVDTTDRAKAEQPREGIRKRDEMRPM